MNSSEALSPFRITPRLIIGLGILTLGVLWTLDNLDVLESEPITRWWPAVLVLIGVVQLAGRRTNRGGPLVLIIIGTLLLLGRARLLRFDAGDVIPLAIALLGAKLIWDAVARKREAAVLGDEDSVVHAFAIMAGVKRRNSSSDFRGGDANAIMGGVFLDLTGAQIRDGGPVVIDAFAFWGGVEIRVPPHWRIESQVLPLMGGFEDNTKPAGEAGPRLVLRGTAIMGGIEVKN